MKLNKCEMSNSIILTVNGIWTKFVAVISSIYGWFTTALMTILNYFLPIKGMAILMGILLVLDFIFGMSASVKLKKHITSDKLRSSLVKTLIYLTILPLSFSIENTIIGGGFSLLHPTIFAIAMIVELISIIGNLLILDPNNEFLKLFKFLVKGELASKLGISKEEVEDLLKKKEK